PPILLSTLGPVLIVMGAGALVLLFDLLPPRDSKDHLGSLALAGVVGALLLTVWQWGTDQRAFRDMVALDAYVSFFYVVICYGVALVLLLSMDYLRRTASDSGEYYALVLFATSGMMLMASATDL